MGAYKRSKGTVTCKNGSEEIKNYSITDSINKGVVYLSEDRKDEGLVLMHSLERNIILPNLDQFGKFIINTRAIPDYSRKYMKLLKVKANSSKQEARRLSGGNQQKVVIAKWVANNADVYIFDEPTRGIDIGARSEIYNIMLDLVKDGASIIMISSDLVEVMRMSNRILVMKEGEVASILENDDALTQTEVLSYALNGRGVENGE